MTRPALIAVLLTLGLIPAVACNRAGSAETQVAPQEAIEREMRRLAAYEVDLVLRSDTKGMEQFYPDDMIVTNPFNQVIDKAKVLERVRENIIRYSAMTKEVEHLRLLAPDTAVIMGLETAKVTPDADRPDAGMVTYRRFTEVWMLRNGEWKKVVRHANHFEPGA
jgi:ketosteroid isomerase-like protein